MEPINRSLPLPPKKTAFQIVPALRSIAMTSLPLPPKTVIASPLRKTDALTARRFWKRTSGPAGMLRRETRMSSWRPVPW